jgi:hypothetical protein
VSVDTHLIGKNLTKYKRYQEGDVEVLISHSLLGWAYGVHLEAKRFLLWQRVKPMVEHKHRPT